METLEKLYNGIDETLSDSVPDWPGFAQMFKTVHGSEVTLYRAVFEANAKTMDRMDVISTSAPELMADYIEREMFKNHQVPETDLSPLEPVRRTDAVPDEVFRKLGPLADYLISNGMFYMINVPAVMRDGSFVCVHAWRDEAKGDFSDLDKQRLALMMRHLLAVVDHDTLVLSETAPDVLRFGEKYGLTPTESEVLGALIEGHSLRSIATSSDRSYGTVRWHVQNILEKCQVKNQKGLLSEFYQLMKR